MCFFKKQVTKEIEPDYREFVIDHLRGLTEKEYVKAIKIVEIYREADEKAKGEVAGRKAAQRMMNSADVVGSQTAKTKDSDDDPFVKALTS